MKNHFRIKGHQVYYGEHPCSIYLSGIECWKLKDDRYITYAIVTSLEIPIVGQDALVPIEIYTKETATNYQFDVNKDRLKLLNIIVQKLNSKVLKIEKRIGVSEYKLDRKRAAELNQVPMDDERKKNWSDVEDFNWL